MINKGLFICCMIDDEKCKIVLEIIFLFNIKLIFWVKLMIKDIFIKFEVLLMNVFIVFFLFKLYCFVLVMNMMIMVKIKNIDVMIGNYYFCVMMF